MVLKRLCEDVLHAQMPLRHAVQKLRIAAEVQLSAAFRADRAEWNFPKAIGTFHWNAPFWCGLQPPHRKHIFAAAQREALAGIHAHARACRQLLSVHHCAVG